MKQIALALHTYREHYGSFPPAYVADASGQRLHSWRVLILPFLEQQELYDQYDFTQPWSSPANRAVLQKMPDIYRCLSHPRGNLTDTHYCAVSGPGTIFPGAEPVTIDAIRDGLSNTLLVGEVTDASIPWTAPYDIDVSTTARLGDPRGFSSHHKLDGKVVVGFLFADGKFQYLSPANLTPAALQKLAGIDDGISEGDAWSNR